MVASKPNVVATAAIRNHKVNGGPGMYFSILAKIKNMMTNMYCHCQCQNPKMTISFLWESCLE